MTVLAIHSPGDDRDAPRYLGRQRLKGGDVLLLQGSVEDIQRLDPRELLNLEDVSVHHPRSPKGKTAFAIFMLSILAGATGVLPMSVAFLGGALGLVLNQCLEPDEGYRAIDWKLIVLIGSMMAFGVAMKETGTSTWLANVVVAHVSPFGRTCRWPGRLHPSPRPRVEPGSRRGPGVFLLTAPCSSPRSGVYGLNTTVASVWLPARAGRHSRLVLLRGRTVPLLCPFWAGRGYRPGSRWKRSHDMRARCERRSIHLRQIHARP